MRIRRHRGVIWLTVLALICQAVVMSGHAHEASDGTAAHAALTGVDPGHHGPTGSDHDSFSCLICLGFANAGTTPPSAARVDIVSLRGSTCVDRSDGVPGGRKSSPYQARGPPGHGSLFV